MGPLKRDGQAVREKVRELRKRIRELDRTIEGYEDELEDLQEKVRYLRQFDPDKTMTEVLFETEDDALWRKDALLRIAPAATAPLYDIPEGAVADGDTSRFGRVGLNFKAAGDRPSMTKLQSQDDRKALEVVLDGYRHQGQRKVKLGDIKRDVARWNATQDVKEFMEAKKEFTRARDRNRIRRGDDVVRWAICDFCGVPDIKANLLAESFTIEIPVEGRVMSHVMDGDWASCEECLKLVTVDDWPALLRRSKQIYGLKARARVSPEAEKFIVMLHAKFKEHYTGRWEFV